MHMAKNKNEKITAKNEKRVRAQEQALLKAENKKTQKEERAQLKKQAQDLAKIKKEEKVKRRQTERALRREKFSKFREKRLQLQESSLPLDNAALIYPASKNNEWNEIFRISAYLKDEVDPQKLQVALEKTMQRFPYYNVALHKGFFWYYFQYLEQKPKVMQEELYPCQPFDFRGDKHLFRVLYYNKKVTCEFFHSLCDGFGGLNFMDCLLINYARECGMQVDAKNFMINPNDIYDQEELEDAFNRYADLKNTNSRKEKSAYQVVGTPLVLGKLMVTSGKMRVDKLKNVAKEQNCSLNELLLATLLYSINVDKVEHKRKKPVKVSLPIDCRRFFQTKTMRNFSSYKNFSLEKQDATLADCIEVAKAGMSEINKEYLMKNINANVLAQKNIFVRLMPLFIKDLALRYSFNTYGERLFSTAFSNLGLLKVPDEMREFVDSFEVMIGRAKLNSLNVATCSYNGMAVVTFTRRIQQSNVERVFFRTLASLGISIDLYSN